jgi:hypothetical protein
MPSRGKKAEVVSHTFINTVIDLRDADSQAKYNFSSLTESLFNEVFSLSQSEESNESKEQPDGKVESEQKRGVEEDQLITFVNLSTDNDNNHHLLKQIKIIRFLKANTNGQVTQYELGILSLLNPDMEYELKKIVGEAAKNMTFCLEEAEKEDAENKKLEKWRKDNPEKTKQIRIEVKRYWQLYGQGDSEISTGNFPSFKDKKEYKKNQTYLEGSSEKKDAFERASKDHEFYSKRLANLEQQKVWLPSGHFPLNMLSKIQEVAGQFVQKYPAARGLSTIDEFLFCLMADALLKLSNLSESYKTNNGNNFYREQSFFYILLNINKQKEILNDKGYLPTPSEVHFFTEAQKKSDLFQFLRNIGTSEHLKFKQTVEGFRVDSNSGIADDKLKYNVTTNQSNEIVSATPSLPFFPVYLAKSFILHLANEISSYFNTITTTKSKRSIKDMDVKEAATWLRKYNLQKDSANEIMSLKDIYNQKILKRDNKTIADILQSTNDEYLDAFAETLTKAGIAFLNENPASLMRRHAFLESLQEACDFVGEDNLKTCKGHLFEVVAQIKELRSVMKVLYTVSSAPIAIVDCISELVAFGNKEKNPNIVILVRLLLLACMDELDQENFTALPNADKSWLLNAQDIITTDKQADLNDKQSYLKAVAKNIADTKEVKKYGVGSWVTALLEITSFQQARYKFLWGNEYTHAEHQEKFETAVLHFSQCVYNYFEESALKPQSGILKPAKVGKIFSGSKGQNSPIVLKVTAYESGDRLRLPVNLQSDIQAMLTWGVMGDNPIHLRTLALLNNRNQAGLEQWQNRLVDFNSPAVLINASMLASLNDDAAENPFIRLDSLNSLAEKIKHYTALVALAETLLQHLIDEQSQPDDEQSQPDMPKNLDLAKFYKAVNDNINRLINVIAQETSAEKISYEDSEALKLLKNRVDAFIKNLLNVCYPKSGKPIAAIQCIKDQVFGDKIIDPETPGFFEQFNEMTSSNIDVSAQVKDDQYFIDVMFTLAHHPMENNQEKLLCGQICRSFAWEDGRIEGWGWLKKRFYGQSVGLQNLIDYYLSSQESSDEVAIKKALKKALKIAIFGFAYRDEENRLDFSEDKLMFAQQILRAFSELVKSIDEVDKIDKIMIEHYDDIYYLKEAFAFLAKTPGLILELDGFIDRLKMLAQKISDETEQHYYSLYIEAKKQAVVYKKPSLTEKESSSVTITLNQDKAPESSSVSEKDSEIFAEKSENQEGKSETKGPGTLLGLKIGDFSSLHLSKSVVTAKDPKNPMDLLTPYNRQSTRALKQIENDIDKIITQLLNDAFPKNHPDSGLRLRYFKTGSLAESDQLDKSDHDDRKQLKKMFCEKIDELKKNKKNKIDSWVLTKAIGELFTALDARVVPDNFITSKRTFKRVQSLFTAPSRTDIELANDKAVFFGTNTLSAIGNKLYARLNELINAKDKLSQDSNAKNNSYNSDDSNEEKAQEIQSYHPDIGDLISDSEEALEISEEAITDAVIAAIKWLEGNPGGNNIPAEVSSVINTSNLTEESINRFKCELAGIQVDWFAYRVKLIRDGKSDLAFRHVLDNVRSGLLQGGHGYGGELSAFIGELQKKTQVKQEAKYKRYLNDFVWAAAEKIMLKQKIRSNEELSLLLEVIVNRGYDDVALIALGCEQYAMMNEEAQSEKGSQLLKALLYIVCQAKFFKKDSQSCSSDIIEELKTALNTMNQKQSHNNGTSIYHYIYTLAQAMSYEEDSVIKSRYNESVFIQDSRCESTKYTDTADRSSDENSNDQDDEECAVEKDSSDTLNNSDARKLLDKLHALLFSNRRFAEWHREIITKQHKGPESHLQLLIFHTPYGVSGLLNLLNDPEHSNSQEIINRIAKCPYFWEKSYVENPKPLFLEQFAYEALAIDELVRILNPGTITKDEQHNSILEQLALVFLAAERCYKLVITEPNYLEEELRTPFVPALSLLASGFGSFKENKENVDFQSTMKLLLEKACDSFNTMLRVNDQKTYALNESKYVLLKREVIKWLQDTPEILQAYVNRTLNTGVNCKEQAELIFQLLSQPSTTRHGDRGRQPARDTSLEEFSNFSYQPVNTEVGEDPRSVEQRTDNQSDLLCKAFEWMYDYIYKGIHKSKGLKLFGNDAVKPRLTEFLEQVEKHNLWEDYWCYVAGLEKQSDTVKNYVVGNRYNEKGEPYLKPYTDLLWNYWVKHPSVITDEDDVVIKVVDENDVVIKVVMEHLFGNYVAMNDRSGALAIVDWLIKDNISNIDNIDTLSKPGLTAFAACLVKRSLDKFDKDKDKDKYAYDAFESAIKQTLPRFLKKNPTAKETYAFLDFGPSAIVNPFFGFTDESSYSLSFRGPFKKLLREYGIEVTKSGIRFCSISTNQEQRLSHSSDRENVSGTDESKSGYSP